MNTPQEPLDASVIMPRANKRSWDDRALEEIANKDDSNDEDYSDRKPRARKYSSTKARTKGKRRPTKKRRRNSDDEEEDDSEVFEEDDDLSTPSEYGDVDGDDDENAERNARGGIKRRAASKSTYRIPSSDEEEEEDQQEEDEEQEEGNDGEHAQSKGRDSGEKRRGGPMVGKADKSSLLVKFPVNPNQPGRTTRVSRGRSSSAKVEPTSQAAHYLTRRTTRGTYDTNEDIIALTTSGHHVETVRRGTHSPEAIPRTRGTHDQREATIPEEKEDGKGVIASATNASQEEVMESDPQGDFDETPAVAASDNIAGPTDGAAPPGDIEMGEEGFVPESQHAQEDNENDDDEEGPVTGRNTRANRRRPHAEKQEVTQPTRRSTRRRTTRGSRQPQDEGSDFEPNEEEGNDDDLSDSEATQNSPQKGNQHDEDAHESSNDRRSRLRKRKSQSRAESEAGELAEELADLKPGRRRRVETSIVYEDKPRRNRKSVDYRVYKPDFTEEVENEVTESPSRRPRGGGGGWQRSLLSTYGPFGGGGDPPPLLGGPAGLAATGGVDSDSSDDEVVQRPKIGNVPGLTPTTGIPHGQGLGQAAGHLAEGPSGTPANLGKIKDKQALADADPLGIEPNVDFNSVGGLQGHIDQLKEMVSLPLSYPEIFQRFNIVPPRGVLFHGPPGTGKTLLARALASSVSGQTRKVSFYMRKGADALSKWVGEAERQLRLLFEEARKTQPSIIFFDEIDGES